MLPLFLREAKLPALPLPVCRRQAISAAPHGCCATAGKHGFPVPKRKHGLRTPQTPPSFSLVGNSTPSSHRES